MISGIKINEKQREIYEEKGYWGDKTLLDYWNESVKKYGGREYVVDDKGCRYTYNEVDDKAGAVASYFQQKGIKPQDVISFQIPVWSEFAILTVACLKVGAVINPIAMCYSGDEIAGLMKVSESRIFVCPTWYHKTDYEEQIFSAKDQLKSLEHIVLLDNFKEKKSEAATLQEIIAEKAAFKENARAQSNDVAAILWTSGTTGTAKGVMLTHNNIIFGEKYFNKELGLTNEDVMFMPAPLNHATGFSHGIIAPMLMGAKVVLQGKFKSTEAIDLMNMERCTYSMGPTPFIFDILNEMRKGASRIPSLKFYLCGGAPIPGYMVRNAFEYQIKLCEVYGSTESAPHAFVRPEETLDLMGSISGRPVEGVEVKIVDDSRKEVSMGVMGEEASRGPNVFVGYLNERNMTDKVLDDHGWFYSGDLCIGGEKNSIQVVGRKKDMIIRGGENLNSNLISEYISTHPKVKDQAVIGMPDERLGERICAYIVLKPGVESLNKDDLRKHLRERKIPKRYWPERIEIIEKIQRTDSGKVKKGILIEDLKARMSRDEEEYGCSGNTDLRDPGKPPNQGLYALT